MNPPIERVFLLFMKPNQREIHESSDKPLQEKCGIVGVYSAHFLHHLPLAVTVASGVQHRGQYGTGMALRTKNTLLSYTGNGLLREVLSDSVAKKYDHAGNWVLVHCRYGTNGGYQTTNLQPCIAQSAQKESIAVIHNGEFAGVDKMKKKIKTKLPKDASDTYIFTRLLAQASGRTWKEKVIRTLRQVNGAYSMMIGIKNQLFIARDSFGLRPLVFGKMQDRWVIASETHALDKIGVKVIREVQKGEIICFDKNGMTVIQKGTEGVGNFCDFEWAYFHRPDSLIPTRLHTDDYRNPKRWLSVGYFRERCGEILGHESPIRTASFVVGVPDSGVAVAEGYAIRCKLPYRQVIIRDHFDRNGAHRLFMGDDEKAGIRKKILGKLSLIPDGRIWHDAVVVIGDDSFVRGNVSIEITSAVFAMGAKEVHWIIGFPPVNHTCHLGVSMRTQEELIAARNHSDPIKIAQEIGATSIHYISPIGFLKARIESGEIHKPANPEDIFLVNGGCGGCVTGRYPVDKSGNIHPVLQTNP